MVTKEHAAKFAGTVSALGLATGSSVRYAYHMGVAQHRVMNEKVGVDVFTQHHPGGSISHKSSVHDNPYGQNRFKSEKVSGAIYAPLGVTSKNSRRNLAVLGGAYGSYKVGKYAYNKKKTYKKGTVSRKVQRGIRKAVGKK